MSGVLRKIEGEFPERVETGPVQFGGDWPGVFIRGDNALYFAHVLEMIIAQHGERMHSLMELPILKGLISDLQSCDMRQAALRDDVREGGE